MSTPVQPRKKVFWDNDGNLLQGGKIYVGDPDKDPRVEAYRATVTFEDSSGATFTAVQPLRTINGKIVYDGLPIIATVAGEHSLLVADSTDVILDYTASVPVDATTGTDYTSLIQVGLTLPDVKALDVSVGNVARSVGRVTATDGLGADWLVVSATGSPADDIDLIDFDNGLQGQRDVSKLYPDRVLDYVANKTFNPDSPTEVWSGSATTVDPSLLSDSGPGFYIIKTSNAYFSLIAQAELTTLDQSIIGTSDFGMTTSASPYDFSNTVATMYVNGAMTVRQFRVVLYAYTLSNTGTIVTGVSATYQTITNIYKV